MPPVNIDVSLIHPPQRHVTGCELPIAVTLTNTATTKELLLVQSPESDVPFEYELVSARGSFTLSKRLYDQAALEHGVPPPSPQLQPLTPGESCTYTDDVAQWMTTPIPAGNYELLVHWIAPSGERVTAPSVSVSLNPVRAEHHVSVGDLDGQVLLSAFAHDREPTTLFRRVSEYARPSLGYGRTVTQAPSLDGVALACELDDVSQWRWYTWLADGLLHGAIHWGSELVKTLDPTPVGVSNAKLLPIGWQTRHAAAVFVVLGEAAGSAAVDVILLPQLGTPQHCVYPLQCPVPDVAVAGSYHPGLGILELVLGFDRGGHTRLLSQHVDFSLTDSPAPRLLLETAGALRALAVAPRVHEDSTVDAVVGETLYRIGLKAGAVEQISLPALPGAHAWSLPSVPHPSCPVLAQVNNTLKWVRAKDASEWLPVASSADSLSHASIIYLAPTDGSGEGRLVCAYIDEQLGYSVVELSG